MTSVGHEQSPVGPYTVTAAYRDMEAAREAVGSLEERGVPASDIRLLGRLADEAATATATSGRDRKLVAYAARSVFGGMLLVGAAAFLVAGAAAAIAGLRGTGLLGTAVAAGAGGAFLGFVLGGIGRVKQSEAWELTYQQTGDAGFAGEIGVGVRTSDPDQADVVERTLRETAAVAVERTVGEGG